MSKILLVYDDFAELNATELSLKKCGFDVIGLTNEYTVKDQIVAFNPEILVGFGNSQRVNSLTVGKKLKDMNRWAGKSILIFPKGHNLAADELIRMRMDMLLESPISVIRLIQIICKLLKLDDKQVIEKLAKSFAKDRNDDLAFASYDADTVKMIQSIQGELENLGSEKTIASAGAVTAATGDTLATDAAPTESAELGSPSVSDPIADEPVRTTKKSFFELESEAAAEKAPSEGDPFAALISELKGESPAEAAAAAKKSIPLPGKGDLNLITGDVPKEKASAVTGGGAGSEAAKADKPAMEPEEYLDFNVVGQQIKDEIASSASELSEKMKRYTQLTEELHLYPESTIKKVKAKKQLNDLKKGWNPDDLEDQDKARREFVTQLFKTKKD